MLNEKQIAYLSSLHGGIVYAYDKIVSIVPAANKQIKVPYKDFKTEMGLEDIRFHWMLKGPSYIAGGAMVAWVMNEENRGDTDFYFKDSSYENFIVALEGLFHFERACESGYAITFVNPENNAVIQVVNGRIPDGTLLGGDVFTCMGTFDLGVCKFAVDAEFVYTYKSSIRDLLTKSIRIVSKPWCEGHTCDRIIKYSKKGLYLPRPLLGLQEKKYGDFTIY